MMGLETFAAQLPRLIAEMAAFGFCAGAFVTMASSALLAAIDAFKQMAS